jgi:hypothetical protein
MNTNRTSFDNSPPSPRPRIDEICDRFEQAWKDGQRPRIEDFLGDYSEPERADLLRELLRLDLAWRRKANLHR